MAPDAYAALATRNKVQQFLNAACTGNLDLFKSMFFFFFFEMSISLLFFYENLTLWVEFWFDRVGSAA